MNNPVLPLVPELRLLIRSDIIHSFFGDDTNVDVVSGAEVTHDSSADGETHELLRFLQLKERRRKQRNNENGGQQTERKEALIRISFMKERGL